MEPELRNKLIIAGSIGLAIVAGIFIKNKIEENRFTPLSRDRVLDVLKKSKKENYPILKQVAAMASKIGEQMKLRQVDPNMVKQYLESPESPIKIVEVFEENYKNICKTSGIAYNDFDRSLEFYTKNEDKEIISFVEQIEKDYELSLSGKIPQFKVNVPANLTKERIIEINKKIVLSTYKYYSEKYLIQVDMIRKIRGKSEAELTSNPSILEGMPNPEAEEEKILEEEGLGNNEEPATAVFYSAMGKYRNDTAFKETLQKIETDYMKSKHVLILVFEKYRSKLQQNKMSENDLNELEDELIYSQQV